MFCLYRLCLQTYLKHTQESSLAKGDGEIVLVTMKNASSYHLY